MSVPTTSEVLKEIDDQVKFLWNKYPTFNFNGERKRQICLKIKYWAYHIGLAKASMQRCKYGSEKFNKYNRFETECSNLVDELLLELM